MAPATTSVLRLLQRQGSRGVTAMDAMRALGMAGGSFTKRISELREVGLDIRKTMHKDPIGRRQFGRYTIAAFLPKVAA